MSDPLDELARLRRQRGGRERDRSIGGLIAETARAAERMQRRLGTFVELWEAMVPPALAARSRVTAGRGGTVTVVVDSAATRYAIDRLLREGLEQQLRQRYPATLTKIRLVVGVVG